jgi:hypothetical protein
MTILYPKKAAAGITVIQPAVIGAAGANDVSSGCQVATVNGTIGNTTVPAALPGQSLGLASVVDFHTKTIVP